MRHIGERVCTLTLIITGLVANNDDPIEMPGGIILPENGFEDYLDLSIKLDKLLEQPRYRFNRPQLIADYFQVMKNSFVELKELEEETGPIDVEDVEERLLDDFNLFLDSCLCEEDRHVA